MTIMEIFTQHVAIINSSISFNNDFYLFKIVTAISIVGAIISIFVLFILNEQEEGLKHSISALSVFFVFMLGNVSVSYWYNSYDYTDKYIGTPEYESFHSVTQLLGLDTDNPPLTLDFIDKVQCKSSALQKEIEELLIRTKLLGLDSGDSAEIALTLLVKNS